MKQFPIARALKHGLKDYSLQNFKHDFLAAFLVSLVALPLSMALAIAVGLPPQHGIYTAIVAGIVVPLLGGSLVQVSGPTAAFVVILAPIVSEYGLRGIVWCSILAGIILILFAITGIGKLINYIPYPVTTGFTAGIAVVLATLSLNEFLGLGIKHFDGSFINKVHTLFLHLPNISIYDTFIGLVTLGLLFFSQFRLLPSTLVAILAGTLFGVILNYFGYDIQTIGNHFSYVSEDGTSIGGIPPQAPWIGWPTFEKNQVLTIPNIQEIRLWLFPALTIAILAALESLLSATVADSIIGKKHHPDSELSGIGIGNILSGLALGIPATGAIARTATLINSGGKTPLASSMHAVFILIHVLLLAKWMSYIPMAALSALLINTAYRMSHYKQFINVIKLAHKSDTIVLLICFSLTIFIDMIAGVGIGMICASFLLIKRIIDLTSVELESKQLTSTLCDIPEDTLVYRIRGPLFFGTIEKAFDRQNVSYDAIKHFIVDISDVPFMDMTGMVAMKSMLASIAKPHRAVHIICNNPEVEIKILNKIKGEPFSRFVYFHQNIKNAIASGHEAQLTDITAA